MRTPITILILIGTASCARMQTDIDIDPAPIVLPDAATPIPDSLPDMYPADLFTVPAEFTTRGRIGDPCYVGPRHCGSYLCIGEGEPYPGLCATRLCGTDRECDLGHPCVQNTRSDRERHPRYCAP